MIGFFGEPRILTLGKYLNLRKGIFLDSMHGVCFGVAKNHLSLLFNGSERYLTREQVTVEAVSWAEFFLRKVTIFKSIYMYIK
jgi:hypothetical protein